MQWHQRIGLTALYGLLGWGVAMGIAGCGRSGRNLAGVTGVVTLDGKPLPEAVVEFQPPSGSPSEGLTDKEGVYRLKYTHDKKGATIGTHRVRIRTYRNDEDEPGRAIVVKEVVPARYNQQSELIAEVKPGRNTIDFSLNSRGNIPPRHTAGPRSR